MKCTYNPWRNTLIGTRKVIELDFCSMSKETFYKLFVKPDKNRHDPLYYSKLEYALGYITFNRNYNYLQAVAIEYELDPIDVLIRREVGAYENFLRRAKTLVKRKREEDLGRVERPPIVLPYKEPVDSRPQDRKPETTEPPKEAAPEVVPPKEASASANVVPDNVQQKETVDNEENIDTKDYKPKQTMILNTNATNELLNMSMRVGLDVITQIIQYRNERNKVPTTEEWMNEINSQVEKLFAGRQETEGIDQIKHLVKVNAAGYVNTVGQLEDKFGSRFVSSNQVTQYVNNSQSQEIESMKQQMVQNIGKLDSAVTAMGRIIQENGMTLRNATSGLMQVVWNQQELAYREQTLRMEKIKSDERINEERRKAELEKEKEFSRRQEMLQETFQKLQNDTNKSHEEALKQIREENVKQAKISSEEHTKLFDKLLESNQKQLQDLRELISILVKPTAQDDGHREKQPEESTDKFFDAVNNMSKDMKEMYKTAMDKVPNMEDISKSYASFGEKIINATAKANEEKHSTTKKEDATKLDYTEAMRLLKDFASLLNDLKSDKPVAEDRFDNVIREMKHAKVDETVEKDPDFSSQFKKAQKMAPEVEEESDKYEGNIYMSDAGKGIINEMLDALNSIQNPEEIAQQILKYAGRAVRSNKQVNFKNALDEFIMTQSYATKRATNLFFNTVEKGQFSYEGDNDNSIYRGVRAMTNEYKKENGIQSSSTDILPASQSMRIELDN